MENTTIHTYKALYYRAVLGLTREVHPLFYIIESILPCITNVHTFNIHTCILHVYLKKEYTNTLRYCTIVRGSLSVYEMGVVVVAGQNECFSRTLSRMCLTRICIPSFAYNKRFPPNGFVATYISPALLILIFVNIFIFSVHFAWILSTVLPECSIFCL